MTREVKVVLRNPVNKSKTVDFHIDVEQTIMGRNWLGALNGLLINDSYLEKNFLFLGFPNTARDINFICKELQWVKNTINDFKI